MKVSVTDIQYDTDGEEVDLPTTLNIEVPDDMDGEDVEEYISDEISNITGFCHTGFSTDFKFVTYIQEQKYIKNGGNNCPHCGSDDISGLGFEADGNYAWRECECNECNKEWNENFTLTGISL